MAIAGVMGLGENRPKEEVRKVYLKGVLFFKRKKEFWGFIYVFIFFNHNTDANINKCAYTHPL